MLESRSLTLLLLGLASSTLCAQSEILYYKFDEAGGTKVINFAPPTSPAPEEGNITSTDVSAFAPGRLGLGSLRGGSTVVQSFVETGWNGAFSGDFTVAFFLKHRNPPSSATYFYGNNVGLGFRAFTAGVANRGLIVRNWGGAPADLLLTKDLQTLVQTNWVHVALVVDTGRGSGTFYLDGVAEPALNVTAGANVPAGPGFRVGAQLTPASTYDMDEFRFLNRAASPVEIAVWALRSTAADSPYGGGCGATLGSGFGPPALGNARYLLNLSAAAGQPYVLVLGSSRTTFLGVPLPFDLGAVFPALPGCQWETSMFLAFGGLTNSSGVGALPLGIPNDASLEAAALYAQSLILRTGTEQSSNPFVISLGG